MDLSRLWPAVAALLALAASAAAAPLTLHVAPDRPLTSLAQALAEARRLRAAGAADAARIVVHGGTYYLPATLTLGPEDSGLTIEGVPGEPVVVSGGRRVTGWRPWREGILQADLSALDLPDLSFRELYYNRRLMPWARVPNFDPQHPRTGGFLQNDGLAEVDTKTKFRYPEGSLDPGKWAHPERAWMVFHDSLNYETQFCPVRGIDGDQRVIEAAQGVYVLSPGNPFYLCGLLEELDAPGEWCVDPDTKTLYFRPPAGDPNAADEVIVPALTEAFVLQGRAADDQWVQGVRLAWLEVRDVRGRAVSIFGARDCTVAACELRNAEVGVYLGDDTHACRVVGCDITQTQGDGVSVLGSSPDHERVSDHVVDNNYIWDFGWGRIHNRCGGVYMHRCARVQVTHNHLHDGPRYAIGMDVGNDCEIAHNYGHHVNLVTADSGIIEAATALDWGLPVEAQRRRHEPHNWGNRVHHNLIHDSGGWGTDGTGQLVFPYYTWGIYLDLDCSGWQVYDNVCYRTVLGGFMQNGGHDTVVANNVFVDGRRSQIQWNPWTGYAMFGHRCERNVFAYPGVGATLYQLNGFRDETVHFGQNLVWAQGRPPTIDGVEGLPARASWEAWRERGQDEGSAVADPQFLDPAAHDYRLQLTSPAFGLGFQAIDLSEVGNYASPDRRTWPRPEVPVVRDAADYAPQETVARQPRRRDYEDLAVGATEQGAHVGQSGELGVIRVTDETAAGGRHSLQIVERPGLEHAWEPYITYPLELAQGTLRAGFDLRWEAGGPFIHEWRDDPYTYSLGPNLVVDAEGWLAANGTRLLQLPARQWVRLDIECGLGEQTTGTYDLRVQVAGEPAQEFRGLAFQPGFRTLACVVVMSGGTGPATCYLDNVEFEPTDGP